MGQLAIQMGGYGLRSATRTRVPTHWMIHSRHPEVAETMVRCLSGPTDHATSAPLRRVAQICDLGIISLRSGKTFISRPSWDMLRRGLRPRPLLIVEPGEWHHGWQYYLSSNSVHQFRETVVLAQSCAADHANLRSHSGPCASQQSSA